MPNPEAIRSQIEKLTSNLIELSLSIDQNYPSLREMNHGIMDVGFGSNIGLSLVLKNLPYRDVYDELDNSRMFNIKMVDGALIQLMYRFQGGNLQAHRLAFFPSPYMEEFQNNPEIYSEDELFAEVVAKNIVPFPFRFDFDSRDEVVVEKDHPQSHLSLGQYKNCRIPVNAPVTPYYFINFVLRNFYNTAYLKFCEKLTVFPNRFTDTIYKSERQLIYIQIPTGA